MASFSRVPSRYFGGGHGGCKEWREGAVAAVTQAVKTADVILLRIDIWRDGVYPNLWNRSEKIVLTLAKTIFGTRWMRPHRLITVVVLLAYLMGGALHAICDLDVTSASGETIFSLNESHGHGPQSEDGVAAGHHCHGCFSVSVTGLQEVAAAAQSQRQLVLQRDVVLADSATGIDPPPPKLS